MNRIDICKNTIQSIKDYITTLEKLEPHLQKNHFVRKRKLSLFQVITALYFKRLANLLTLPYLKNSTIYRLIYSISSSHLVNFGMDIIYLPLMVPK